MHFTCRSFIGKPKNNNWSQYWENEPDDPNLVSKRGHLFGLLNLSHESLEDDISTIGHDLIFEINQNYFSADCTDISECLRITIDSVANNPLYKTKKIELLIVVVLEKHLYLASYGSSNVIFCRNQQISLLLENNEDQIKTISGPINPEDKLVLTTDSFYNDFGWDKIKDILSTDKIQTIEENFLATLYTIEDQTGLAAAFIQIHYDEFDTVSAESPVEVEISPPAPVIQPINLKKMVPKIQLPQKIKSIFNKPHDSSVYVSHHDISQINIRKKIHLVIAVLLIIGLAVSSYLGYQKNQSVQKEKQYQSYKTELDSKITNIAAVKNVNLDTAQQLAKDSQNLIDSMKKLKIHPTEIDHYQTQIQQVLSQTGSSQNFSPEMFLDTTISFKDQKSSQILFLDHFLYLLDSKNGKINQIDISKKSTKNLYTDDKIKNTKFLTDNANNLYVVSDQNLYSVAQNKIESKIDFSKQSESLVINDVDFWNGALYVLDQTAKSIWKFNPTATSFGSAQNWIKNNQKLSQPASLAIDSNIWVLNENGQIDLYTSGTKQNFNQAKSESIASAANLTTTPDSNLLAFVDNQQYVYLYKKTGELQAKYNLDKIKVTDIALDDKNKVIYVLSEDQKIYKINF